jgi:hypothetical protein
MRCCRSSPQSQSRNGIRLSERVHAGHAKARREGRVGGGPRLVVNRGKMLRLEEEGLSVREIAEEMQARGLSSIAS